jgi:hypothetical protein
MSSNDFTPKKPLNYSCLICDFNTCNKKDYRRHLYTIKHKKMETQGFSIQKELKTPYSCSLCDKKYKDNSGLWRHKKKCTGYIECINEFPTNENYELKEIIKCLMKENTDMKNLMVEVIKNGTHNTINTNSHNKTFNLQIFLNETCKNAMNIMEFADSVKLQLTDLENVGKLGFVDGISNIIVKNLKALDVEKRPVHCTDYKREVLYIKDDNKWEKENENNIKIRKVIKKIAHKNTRLIPEFKDKHPDCSKSSSPFSDQYNKLIVEAMGGQGDNDIEKEDKIIKNLAKEVLIDKDKYGNTI